MKIPFLDLKRTSSLYYEEVSKSLGALMNAQSFVLGSEVEALEKEIAGYCGVRFGIGVASGTDALLLSLKAIGIEPGDAVITTPFSFIATASSIVHAGGHPIFADISGKTYNLCPEELDRFLRKGAKKKKSGWYIKEMGGEYRLKCIMPVHLYGQCADMERILDLAREFRMPVVEDAAQALGAECSVNKIVKKAGGIGIAGCISFYPTKNLGGFGDGGMVVTDSVKIAERLKMLRGHGAKRKKYEHVILGYNSRLDAFQAAGLRIKLDFLDKWNKEREEIAGRYREACITQGILSDMSLPYVAEGYKHIYHQFVIRIKKARERVREFLSQNNIGSEVYYPRPLHLQPCFRYLGYRKGDFPETEKASREVLALPVYPGLTPEEQGYVVEKIAEYFKNQ